MKNLIIAIVALSFSFSAAAESELSARYAEMKSEQQAAQTSFNQEKKEQQALSLKFSKKAGGKTYQMKSGVAEFCNLYIEKNKWTDRVAFNPENKMFKEEAAKAKKAFLASDGILEMYSNIQKTGMKYQSLNAICQSGKELVTYTLIPN